MPHMSPDQIVEIVDRMEKDRSELHNIIDGDWDFYNQKPYAGERGPDGVDRLAGCAHFTSTNPTTYMDLAMHMGSTANRIIHSREPRELEEQAETNNMNELFALGVLKGADDLRANKLMPDVQSSAFSQSLFRGRVSFRVLLRKEFIENDQDFTSQEMRQGGLYGPDGNVLSPPQSRTRTYVEIVDWDPRNVYFGMGKNGLEWACEKSWKSRKEIITEYGVDPEANYGTPEDNYESDYRQRYPVYDYFDRESNTVLCVGGKVLKESEPHWHTRVPVAFAFADNRPQFMSNDGFNSNEKGLGNSPEYGQGFYHADRGLFNEQNFNYSIAKELSRRTIKPAVKAFSRDGSMTLDEGDPVESGQVVPLSTANEENFEPATAYELTPTSLQFMGIVGSMEQRGAFSVTEFGALAQPISGIAISELRMNRLAPMTVHIKAVQSVLKQCLDIARDAYRTGRFDTMSMNGFMQNPDKTFFSRPIPPQMLGGCIYEVEILPTLPRDDAAAVALVSGIKQSGLPVDDKTMLEMLDFQDPMQIIRAHWEQTANRGNPMSMAYNAAKAAYEQGNEALASFWVEEFNIARMTKQLEMLQLMVAGDGRQAPRPRGEAPQRRPRLPSADVIPPEMLGIQHQPNQVAASRGAASNAGQPRNRGVPPVVAAWGL